MPRIREKNYLCTRIFECIVMRKNLFALLLVTWFAITATAAQPYDIQFDKNECISNYDLYSYSDYTGIVATSGNIHNLYRYKLGDGIREHFRSFSKNGMWNSGVINQKEHSGIIVRGGNSNPTDTSVYTVTIENIEYLAPFRIVLIP